MTEPATPAVPPQRSPSDPGMSHVVRRNIDALAQVRAREERQRTTSDRIAAAVSAFAGSMWCVYVHAVVFGVWLAVNAVKLGVPQWDPYPFVMLAMIASVESIFLSTFILITQNRMQGDADRRAELDLQIGLLSEHELTRAIRMISGIAEKMGVERPPEESLADITRDVDPNKVVEEIQSTEEKADD